MDSEILDGIFHKDTKEIFSSFESYAKWYIGNEHIGNYTWIGISTHRSNFENNNLKIEYALIDSLENLGFKVIPIFNYASSEKDSNTDIKDFREILETYFYFEKNIIIEALINLQMVIAIGNDKYDNVFENAVNIFKEIDIPVFKPIVSFYNTIESWENDISGVSQELSSAFTIPEKVGMIEPIIIGCRNEDGLYEPISNRIERFTKRVLKWINLRKMNNKDKKLAIIIHNAPCAGVESTIGLGAGLDVFQSVVNLLNKLKVQNYFIENIPRDGTSLYKLIMKKKAYHDFRWTSVEDIVESKGCLYEMPLKGNEGYMNFYNTLESNVRKDIEKTWGSPPGESMVYKNKIIITGINFGNITVMVQPKRGCYGAKCTGEVCKILHDPVCPPPHNYIATYRYIENIMKANAVIHIGTGGNLERLPGKINALSSRCYPDIVLGNLPNIYAYNVAIGTEGIGPKRRSEAVLIDYLPSAFMFNKDFCELVKLIDTYFEAKLTKSNQEYVLKEEIEEQIGNLKVIQELMNGEESFDRVIKEVRDCLVQQTSTSTLENLHVLGEIPNYEEITSLINEYIQNQDKYKNYLKPLCKNDFYYKELILNIIEDILNKSPNLEVKYGKINKAILEELQIEIVNIYKNLLLCNEEILNLIKALEGKYIAPGLSDVPSDNLKNIIPTGRNFYLLDCEKVPTKEAYKVGCSLAAKLIDKYVSEEGEFPEKISMNMISTDISQGKGEQLSQILNLLGVIPVWDSSGKVQGISIIPLKELKRPRIDVIVRISGVLRDSFPSVIKFLDKAIISVASLSEPEELNFVRKNTLKLQSYLKSIGEIDNIDRRSTIRIFGDKPGAYGAGVDLALKASAWEKEKDLAKVFVQFSSYAYGENLNGLDTKHEFIENVKKSDVSYEFSNNKRNNLISCSFSSTVQGGFKILKEISDSRELKQYHGSTKDKDNIKISLLKEELKNNMKETLFNLLWKENMKTKGYKGAADIMMAMQNVFSWQCTSEIVDNKDLDKLVQIYINDKEMFNWFKDNNPYAIEEISRRFLELNERKKWIPNKETLKGLKRAYIDIEGDMEESMEGSKGETQGGNIEIVTSKDISAWNKQLKDIEKILK